MFTSNYIITSFILGYIKIEDHCFVGKLNLNFEIVWLFLEKFLFANSCWVGGYRFEWIGFFFFFAKDWVGIYFAWISFFFYEDQTWVGVCFEWIGFLWGSNASWHLFTLYYRTGLSWVNWLFLMRIKRELIFVSIHILL